jgi:hypothetical protein
VEKLKDQIDAGELDGKDILASEAPSAMTASIRVGGKNIDETRTSTTSTPAKTPAKDKTTTKRASLSVFGSANPFGKKDKTVKRTTSVLSNGSKQNFIVN